MHNFSHALHALGGYMFLQHCSSGGHKIFDYQIGESQNIAEVGLLSEIHDPLYSKENGGPLGSLGDSGAENVGLKGIHHYLCP